MKKITTYMEIANAACDEHGNPQPAGLSLTVGEPNDEEITGDAYKAILEHIRVEDVLEMRSTVTDDELRTQCRCGSSDRPTR